MKKRSVKLIGMPSLQGCKVGFQFKKSNDIFVCPSVAKLASSDLSLLKGLKVFRLGTKRQPLDLDTWVLEISSQHDIFGEKKDETRDQ